MPKSTYTLPNLMNKNFFLVFLKQQNNKEMFGNDNSIFIAGLAKLYLSKLPCQHKLPGQ
jgi:hypothetical protein